MRASALVIAMLLASCGDSNTATDAALPSDARDDAAQSCSPVVGEPELALKQVAQGFNKPVAIVASPIDDRLFVLEQHTGLAKIVDSDGGVRETPFIDIAGEVARAMEQGLLSLAFHPNYASNGRMFITYTRGSDDAVILEEWEVSSDPNVADKSTRRQLIVVEHRTDIHNGGRAAFGPDGYLYMGLGDGGPQFDLDGNSQNLGDLRGKFIRIDVDTTEGGKEYGIPLDNPFIDTPGARPEIWAYGVRNPWGWSIDHATGHLYFGDVGLAKWEEVDVLPAGVGGGANFGWPILMGDECMTPGCDSTPYVAPLYTYSYINLERCAVVGGVAYRGCKMPGHHGRFFFTDFCASWLRSFRYSGLDNSTTPVIEHVELNDLLVNASAMGVDQAGEMLILDWDEGRLYRIVPAP